MLTSIDREGTRKGFDIPLILRVAKLIEIPLIASGGMGTLEHLVELSESDVADAIAMADILHYERSDLTKIRKHAQENGIQVRCYDSRP